MSATEDAVVVTTEGVVPTAPTKEELLASSTATLSTSSSSSCSSVPPSAPSLAGSLEVAPLPSPGSSVGCSINPQMVGPNAHLVVVNDDEEENEFDPQVCGDDYLDDAVELAHNVKLEPEPPSVIDRLLTFNANGDRGSDGSCGSNGSHGSNGGGRGGNGSPGVRGANGQHATDIHLTHIFSPITTTATVKDRVTGNMQIIPLDPGEGRTPQLIHLTARGGDGGRGGNGGHGGDGGTGHHGRDATRYSSGTNGGPGGDGGNGGNGGAGGTGGNGGHITVTVDEADMDLVLLYDRPNFAGGTGGQGGGGGHGGSGGRGGTGGSSYSWTETHGSGDNRHTTHHHNPGGHNGPSGRSGCSGAHGSTGSNGATGSFTIQVLSHGRTQTYHEPYELRATQYQVQDCNDDGIIEPDDDLRVTFTVVNRGGMPTPVHQPIKLFLQSNTWVAFNVDADHHWLTRSLAPGESYTVHNMRLRVKDIEEPRVGKRLREVARLDYRGLVKRVNRLLPGLRAQVDPFVVQFPVFISAVEGLRTVTRDEEAPMTFSVKNISTHAIGSRVGRPVEAFLATSATDYKLMTDDIIFRDRKGRVRPFLEGLLKQIKCLEPDAVTYISGTVAFNNDDLPAYVHADLTANLRLAGLHDHNREQLRCIQQRLFAVQLTEPYSAKADVDVLLVTNTNTTHEEVRAWERLLAKLGLPNVSSWNISLYGGISFTYRRLDGGTLLEDLKGKLVIFLNNNYSRGAEDSKEAITDLPTRELYLLVRAAGIHTYVVGRCIKAVLPDRILPAPESIKSDYVNVREVVVRHREDDGELRPGTSERRFAKLKRAQRNKRDKLYKEEEEEDEDLASADDTQPASNSKHRKTREDLKSSNKKEAEEEENGGGGRKDEAWPDEAQAKVYIDTYFFRRPRAAHLEKRASRVSNTLAKHVPNQRNVAVYDFQPTLIKKGFLVKHWQLGTETSIASFNRGDDELHQAELIEGSAHHAFHVLKLLPFARKLAVAINVLDQHSTSEAGAQYIEAMKRAILADLTDEQVAFRQHSWSGPLPATKIKKKLKNLRVLCDVKQPAELTTAKSGNQFVVELLVEFETLLHKLPRWWDKLWFRRRQRIVTSISLDLIDRWLRKCGIVSTSGQELKRLRRSWKEQERQTARAVLLERFVRPVAGSGTAAVGGGEYTQDNWLAVPPVEAKQAFEARRPQLAESGEPLVLKEVRSVFHTTEERERALAKLEHFREGIKKGLQSYELQRTATTTAPGRKGKERV